MTLTELQRENERLRQENAALFGILRSLLDESRWPELDELCQPEPITKTVQ